MNKLIVLSVLAVLACAFAAPAENESVALKSAGDAAQQCKSELGTNADDAKILDNKSQLPANEAQKCLIECVGKKLGEIDQNGKLNHEGFINYNKIRYADNKQKLDESEQFYQKCQPEVEKKANEKCGAGYAMRACLIDFFHL